MFYVKRSWQPTLFLYLFIIQDEQWRNKRRSVKVKYGTVLTSGHEAPGRHPGPEGCSVVSPSLCSLLQRLDCLSSQKLKNFSIDWAGCRGVSEVVSCHLWEVLISDERPTTVAGPERIHIWCCIHTHTHTHTHIISDTHRAARCLMRSAEMFTTAD